MELARPLGRGTLYGDACLVVYTLKWVSTKCLVNGLMGSKSLTEAKVASPGTAKSFIKASNVVRTRNAHQVTVSSLYILLRKAYEDYVKQQANVEDVLSFDDWCSNSI